MEQQVKDRIAELLEIVEGRVADFQPPAVHYYDNMVAAGRADYRKHRVELNIVHLRENPESMLRETVAHELAHLVTCHLWILDGRPQPRFKPHGSEWQHVMRNWFGVEPERTHNYDMTNVNHKKQDRWAATCGCRTHGITTTKRNAMIFKGRTYRCTSCRVNIKLTGAKA